MKLNEVFVFVSGFFTTDDYKFKLHFSMQNWMFCARFKARSTLDEQNSSCIKITSVCFRPSDEKLYHTTFNMYDFQWLYSRRKWYQTRFHFIHCLSYVHAEYFKTLKSQFKVRKIFSLSFNTAKVNLLENEKIYF